MTTAKVQTLLNNNQQTNKSTIVWTLRVSTYRAANVVKLNGQTSDNQNEMVSAAIRDKKENAKIPRLDFRANFRARVTKHENGG